MPECTKQTCGECIPLYRYFINQQPVLENEEATITIPCPTGYRCSSPSTVITLAPGVRRLRPDLDPLDPDVDPECGPPCEVNNVPYNPYRELNPFAFVRNDEQEAFCSDIDPSLSDTGASEICPAGKFTYAVPYGGSAALAKSIANARAKQEAINLLAAAILAGSKNCFDWIVENTYPYDYGWVNSEVAIGAESFDVDVKSVYVPPGGQTPAWRYWYKQYGPFTEDKLLTFTYNNLCKTSKVGTQSWTGYELAIWFGVIPPASFLPWLPGWEFPGSTWVDLWHSAHSGSPEPPGTYTDSGSVSCLLPAGQICYPTVHHYFLNRQLSGALGIMHQFQVTLTVEDAP